MVGAFRGQRALDPILTLSFTVVCVCVCVCLLSTSDTRRQMSMSYSTVSATPQRSSLQPWLFRKNRSSKWNVRYRLTWFTESPPPPLPPQPLIPPRPNLLTHTYTQTLNAKMLLWGLFHGIDLCRPRHSYKWPRISSRTWVMFFFFFFYYFYLSVIYLFSLCVYLISLSSSTLTLCHFLSVLVGGQRMICVNRHI